MGHVELTEDGTVTFVFPERVGLDGSPTRVAITALIRQVMAEPRPGSAERLQAMFQTANAFREYVNSHGDVTD